MAVLKDLIVHGRSRFVNGAQFNTINAESIGANEGIFNKLIATSLDAKEATIDNLTTTNAKVVGMLDVQGELHTNAWTNANIANIGGSFYITPTVEAVSGTISITRVSATSWTVAAAGSFATDFIKSGISTSGVAWPANSLVLITGNVTIGNLVYPLGTLKGTLSSAVTASAASTSKTITITGVTDAQNNATPAVLQELYELNNNANISGATFSNGKISLYKLGSYPIGIQMSSMGTNANSMIEIYGGVSANPSVRIGHLAGAPKVNNTTPTGWGIYTNNGYFSGVIVSSSGKIGGFTIGTTDLYNGKTSLTGSTAGIFISTTGIAGGTGNSWWIKSDGTFQFGGTSGITYNGNTLSVPAATITGTLSASHIDVSGIISTGGIVTNTLEGGTFNTANYIRVSTQNSSSLAIGTSGSKTDWRIIAGKTFGVDKAGNLYATSANINGAINATSLTIASNATISDPNSLISNSAIQVGGRNLFLREPIAYSSSSYCAYQLALTKNLVAGETYTIQFWDVNVYHSAKSDADLGIDAYWGGGSLRMAYWHGTSYFTTTVTEDNITFRHADYLSATFTVTSAQASGSGASNLWFNIYNSVGSVAGTLAMSIGSWKIEKGNKATDWSSAPEDVEQYTNDAVLEVADATDRLSQQFSISEDDISELKQVVNPSAWRSVVDISTYIASHVYVGDNNISIKADNSKAQLKIDVNGIHLINESGTVVSTFSSAVVLGQLSGMHLTLSAGTTPRLGFWDGTTEVAYISSSMLSINNATINKTLKVGKFVWKTYENDANRISLAYAP